MSYKRHHKKIEATASQQIVLNIEGYILESDDGIFDTSRYRDNPLLKYSPFLESVFPTVLAWDYDAAELFFTRVETVLDGVIGVYDCYFRRASCNFEWLIDDITLPFEAYREAQQENNEESIRRDLHRRR
jgi:hypothetical protein